SAFCSLIRSMSRSTAELFTGALAVMRTFLFALSSNGALNFMLGEAAGAFGAVIGVNGIVVAVGSMTTRSERTVFDVPVSGIMKTATTNSNITGSNPYV